MLQETRDNEVTLHEDNDHALRWLLGAISQGGHDEWTIGISSLGYGWNEWEFPTDRNGDELILVAYALILKYDCPNLTKILANSLVLTFRILRKDLGYRALEEFVKKHIDFITNYSDGRYPIDLAPAIAEAWTCLQLNPPTHDGYESLGMEHTVQALVGNEPRLALAVAKYYQAQLVRAEAGVEEVRKMLQKSRFG